MDQPASKKDLRNFGLLVGAVFGVIGSWPLLYRGEPLRLWAVGLSGALIALGGLLPGVLSPIQKAWMRVGHIMGWINTRFLLGMVFYGLVTPTGVIFRLLGKDTMRQAFTEECLTYRVIRKPRPRGHMKYQF